MTVTLGYKGTELDRFSRRCARDLSTGCVNWTGGKTPLGYGRFFAGGDVYAHRWSYERFVGPIPAGLVLDHLCRNRACVNPEHLETVTQRENVLRGEAPPARCAQAAHCPKGHAYDEENTLVSEHGRFCRECNRIKGRARYWSGTCVECGSPCGWRSDRCRSCYLSEVTR